MYSLALILCFDLACRDNPIHLERIKRAFPLSPFPPSTLRNVNSKKVFFSNVAAFRKPLPKNMYFKHGKLFSSKSV